MGHVFQLPHGLVKTHVHSSTWDCTCTAIIQHVHVYSAMKVVVTSKVSVKLSVRRITVHLDDNI